MSRGLTSEESSKLIVMGFIAPVIDKISDKKLKEDIYNAFAAKLS
jgi:Fe-S cluster assembly scaffold protein SufB